MCDFNNNNLSSVVDGNVLGTNDTSCANGTTRGSGRPGASYGYQRFSCGFCDTACVYNAIQTVFVIGIFANFFVIARVVRDRRLRDSTFVAIAALAVADLLFLTLNLTTAFERVVLSVTCSSPKIISTPYYIMKSVFWFSANTHVALLAILRYITLAYPLRANAYMSPRKVIVSSIVVWVLGSVITGTLTGLISAGLILPGRSQEFLIFLWIFVYLIPLIVTCVLHIIKVFLVKRSISETTTESTRKSIQRMSKIVIVVIVLAAILPLPRLIHKCLKLAGRDVYPANDFSTHFGQIAELLFISNNFINPFIYGFLSEKFRRSLKEMFSCLPGVSEDSTATSDTPLSSRKQSYNLEAMSRKYSYADSLDSVERM